ncbi:MAG: FmdB family zinc ribbon protein [Planctomycetota bacterium]|jgi:putative FmdB family regulatory protein
MPIYPYQCSGCGHEFEEMQGVNDPLLRKCPECGKMKLKKQITSAQLHMRYSLMAPRHMRGQRRMKGKGDAKAK